MGVLSLLVDRIFAFSVETNFKETLFFFLYKFRVFCEFFSGEGGGGET